MLSKFLRALVFTSTSKLLLLTLVFLGVLAGKQNLLAIANSEKNSVAIDKTQNNSNRPVLLGVYPAKFLGDENTINTELGQIDKWAGKRISIAGSFIDIETPNPGHDIPVSLESLRRNGYTGFINLASKRTAAEIARGDADEGLNRLAKAYASWAGKGEGRMAFIAPLPEMNGSWESYKEDPENFKRAYQRIEEIFARAGVPRQAVRWVFAPNGMNLISSIKRMQAMAPRKPIFIAQTATTSYTKDGPQSSAKDRWFQDTYTYLATAAGVRGILYFNIHKECDWELFSQSRGKYEGYKQAIANPAFGYLSPTDLARIGLEY